MEVLPSDMQNLEKLLEAFGSMVSLKDIASVYCQSGRDLFTASQILSDQHSSTSMASASTSRELLESVDASLSVDSLEKADCIKSKPRKAPASLGTVSGVIGRDYARTKPSINESMKPKPLKLNSHDIPASEIWDEKDSPYSMRKTETLHKDTEEFLFKMLGDGFHLERSVIQDIVGQCGYDMNKSMEKLLSISASKFEKSDDIRNIASEIPIESRLDLECKQQKDQFPYSGSYGRKNSSQLPNGKEVSDLQKEILGALFTVSGRSEEPEKRHPVKVVRRPRTLGQVVEEPLKETIIEHQPIIVRKQTVENDEEEIGDEYEFSRKSAMKYWLTMKEYYKSAVDAFCKHDHERAQKLLEEGHFFMRKAREADEKSAQKLLERNDDEEMLVDLHVFDPKAALRYLKLQLNNLSGISSIKHLKVLAGSSDEDINHERRRRMIIKLLDRENIRWTQEGNGWTIVIPLAEIDPTKLSFAKK
ncbi:hypothetical protein M9H77_21930 [Catharanthus roseus]|uniref:Uncharacterized protein n=1 Tax=Catharanthus roseus TaxID=4058 RepID=A0ACC0ANP4_CATRO|nr:hypothetical protein M9H77_21930 [Catharanthus roseus]